MRSRLPASDRSVTPSGVYRYLRGERFREADLWPGSLRIHRESILGITSRLPVIQGLAIGICNQLKADFAIVDNRDGKPEADPISSRNMQNHFVATTGFTCSYSGFFHSVLLYSSKSALPGATSSP